MKLLAIDTSTEACSCALLIGQEVRARFQLAAREHSALILPMCDGLLGEAGLSVGQLDALAFGRGPGSFTGVRIAAGVAQGLAFAADLPVVPVSTLAALAQGAYRDGGVGHVMAAIDARMHEVYCGWYSYDAQAGIMSAVGHECVCAPGQVPLAEGTGWVGVGTGWGAAEALVARLGDRVQRWEAERYPHAADVALLGVAGLRSGHAVAAEQALPLYLRDNVVRAPGQASDIS